MNNEQAEYVNWMNSLLRPKDNLAEGLEQLARLKTENAELRAIIQTLAESNPYSYSDNTGLMECVFCNDSYGWPPFDKVTKDHEPDCLISKAQALVKEQSA